MNYEDESYVRLYTRDTPSWKLLGWKGQTVLMHMMRDKFDRAGIFEYGTRDSAKVVAAITGLPLDIVQDGLPLILEEEIWVDQGGRFVWPKFVYAQTCTRTDKARQRESRKTRRDLALVGTANTDGDHAQAVTTGHDLSQPVTPSLTKPSLADVLLGAPTPKKQIRWKRFPEDFVPDETHKRIAAEEGQNLNYQLELIRDHEFKEFRTDAAATFRTWLRNAGKFSHSSGYPKGNSVKQQPPVNRDENGRRQI